MNKNSQKLEARKLGKEDSVCLRQDASIDLTILEENLDTKDFLILREFYGNSHDNYTCFALPILLQRLTKSKLCKDRFTYISLYRRLQNIMRLGVLHKIPRTNPSIYYTIRDVGAYEILREFVSSFFLRLGIERA